MGNEFRLSRSRIEQLTQKYGSPLYVYDEDTLRTRCREMKSLVDYPNK